jgi:four helix bundle protein
VYRITKNFPKEEQFGITSQIRRSASSVAANIAEGKGRKTTKDFIRFLIIARGSNEETKYFLMLGKDLQYLNENTYSELAENADHIGRMINKLIYSLEK